MDRMWINSILGEADKCYIPNILLLRVPRHHAATGSLELCTHNHKFTLLHRNTRGYKAKGSRRNTWKMHTETLIWACGIATILPDIPAPVCLLQWVAAGGGKEMRRVDGGQNHKFGMSHGQTEKIYDWSGSTSAAWCCGFRMPGMGVRSDSGFSLYTLSGNCSQCDWLKKAVLLGFGVGNVLFRCLVF